MSLFGKILKGASGIIGSVAQAAGGVIKNVPGIGPIAGGLIQGAGKLIQNLGAQQPSAAVAALPPAAVIQPALSVGAASTVQSNLSAKDVLSVKTDKAWFAKYWWAIALPVAALIGVLLFTGKKRRR